MNITRKELRQIIKEAMSKQDIVKKLDKYTSSEDDEQIMQGLSLAHALPDPESLDLDSSYEYQRRVINRFVARRDRLKKLLNAEDFNRRHSDEIFRIAMEIYHDSIYGGYVTLDQVHLLLLSLENFLR